MRERLSTALTQGWELIARQALGFGQVTVDFLLGAFVMLYLLFYLLRDGATLLAFAQRAVPLPPEQQQVLASSFTATVRGVLKGDLVVAVVQGILGGLIFWALGIGAPILWGAIMAVLSVLPVLGTGLVWVPAAIYLLLTGPVWKGIVLLAFGTLVISTIDNVLRPVLVGTDAKMPSYVVLVSTLGGIAIFGINGFVIGPLLAALFVTAWEMYLQVARTTRFRLQLIVECGSHRMIGGWPDTASPALGLMVGVNLISSGLANTMAALGGRSLFKTVAGATR